MKIKNESEAATATNITKTSLEVIPSKVTLLRVFKKMITEFLLVLPLYLALSFIWYGFRHLIKIMADVEDILNDVIPKEATEQHRKREELKNVIDKGKLGDKWTHEIINKTYAEYKQCELNEKGAKTVKALGKHVINLYSTGISQWLKIKDVKKLLQDIENDPIIKDQLKVIILRLF